MSADVLGDLFAAARAADPACEGCALVPPGESRAEWLIVDRADGLRVRLDGVEERSPAVAAVRGLDLSAEAVGHRAAVREITAGITALLTGTDGYTSALRVILRGLATELNDLYERAGLPRKLEAERVQQWVRDAMAGAGAPPGAEPSVGP